MPWLSFEVDALRAAVLSDETQIGLTVEAGESRHLHLSTRRLAEGHLLVIAVNTDTTAQDVELMLYPAPAADSLHVISEDRTVPLAAGGLLRDRFEPYATHLYSTLPILAERPTIADAQSRIDRADAARQKPGNLAFETQGTQAEVSSKSTFGSTPTRLFDGVTTGMRWRDGTRGELPDWLTLSWPTPQRLGRVVVYGNVTGVTLQGPSADGEWQDLDGETLVGDGLVEIGLRQSVTTDELRLQIDSIEDPTGFSVVYEVEAYGP